VTIIAECKFTFTITITITVLRAIQWTTLSPSTTSGSVPVCNVRLWSLIVCWQWRRDIGNHCSQCCRPRRITARGLLLLQLLSVAWRVNRFHRCNEHCLADWQAGRLAARQPPLVPAKLHGWQRRCLSSRQISTAEWPPDCIAEAKTWQAEKVIGYGSGWK